MKMRGGKGELQISELRTPTVKVIIAPETLKGMPGVEMIAFGADGNSAIIYKKLIKHLPEREVFAKAASLTIVCRGKKRITSSGGDFFELGENEAIFLPPDLYMISELLPAKGGVFESYIFFFQDSLIEEFLKTKRVRLVSDSVGDLFRIPYGGGLKLYAENLRPLFASLGRKSDGLLRIKLLEALQIFASSDKTGIFPDWLFKVSKDRHRDLKGFMEKNFDKPLTVEDFAALTGRSISSFQRDFKRRYGISPKKWLISRRLEKAKRLLEIGGTGVADAALVIGYENTSHFIRAFQNQYGVTPGEFLKNRGLVV
ncbi:DNA-binding helix-turn-helix protein [Leptospira inadai serovar Lyme str. 10]|uniref:DNA-binding helix-turn-helix protein n=3 Tax=Leptospira inadai TaxID=29506 RepID=V6HHS4_9LEPT|nr:AraC family transcriptional regulator [Leptospira inadai]EQA36055.1 DNA-binding helix-turn-helix protein [Leptospira inadai serovar Lyme str. 10]PNV76820.1 AraC family transcriptional regulator [Leptospira inadai serovar Lyme]